MMTYLFYTYTYFIFRPQYEVFIGFWIQICLLILELRTSERLFKCKKMISPQDR